MTMANASYAELLDVASGLNCVGVELRTDLADALFSGSDAAVAAQSARDKKLRILALSEVTAFNDPSHKKLEQAESLMQIARSCGAEAISLIPRNDAQYTAKKIRTEHLRQALLALAPLLKSYGLIGFIEPLGFEESSIRHKREVVDMLESLNCTEQFKLVHDTFHHYLAGDDEFYPQHTGIVHVSGVVESNLTKSELTDAHRVLVDSFDCLDNIGQIRVLFEGGYTGPVSYEAFSPERSKGRAFWVIQPHHIKPRLT